MTNVAGVAVRPPLLFLGTLLSGLWLHAFWPVEAVEPSWELAGGVPLVVAAAVLFVLAIRAFRRAATPVRTSLPTRVLVRSAPYRFSRNPIYLALVLLQAGIGIWVNSAWVIATLLPALLILSLGVIAREERYLEAHLGEEYRGYKRSVRRWI